VAELEQASSFAAMTLHTRQGTTLIPATIEQVHFLSDLSCVALDTQSEEACSAPTPKRRQADAFGLDNCRVNERQKQRETPVERCCVHVPETAGAGHGGYYLLAKHRRI
jgi:hypothetical protein